MRVCFSRSAARVTTLAMHPVLFEFFTNTHDALVANLRASRKLSAKSKGTARENDIDRLLGALLPPLARLQHGDLIDSYDRTAGEVDRVVVQQTVPVAAKLKDDTSIILAEGVVAVLEIKSDLNKQWSQVEKKWRMVGALRRRALPGMRALPFIVIGLQGWTKGDSLRDRVADLARMLPPADVPPIMMVCLDPPLLAHTIRSSAGIEVTAFTYNASHRAQLLAFLWSHLADWSRAVLYTQIPWKEYLVGADAPPESTPSA
jgi:hypothetical protein